MSSFCFCLRIFKSIAFCMYMLGFSKIMVVFVWLMKKAWVFDVSPLHVLFTNFCGVLG